MKAQRTAKSEVERLVIGLSGASGVAYGIRLLEAVRELGIESHLVMTRPAEMTIGYETKLSPKQVTAKADYSYAVTDIAAPIASGSFKTKGMIVAPCSVRTMSEIATGVTTSLLTRAADVMLKERRPLVLMVRETPLHLGHLRTMVQLAEMGAVIAPPMPAFYAAPQSLADIVDQAVGRALDLFGLSWRPVRRWGQDIGPAAPGADG
jgi:flavin prenyltransferase